MTTAYGATAQHYRAQQIMTASNVQRVVMLYDGAITALGEAIRAIEEKDIARRHRANRKACDIIEHLMMTLDEERGGQIARNLDQLYRFMLQHLLNVDLHNDPKPAQEVIELLKPLAQAWRDLDRQAAASAAGSNSATMAGSGGAYGNAPSPNSAAPTAGEGGGARRISALA